MRHAGSCLVCEAGVHDWLHASCVKCIHAHLHAGRYNYVDLHARMHACNCWGRSEMHVEVQCIGSGRGPRALQTKDSKERKLPGAFFAEAPVVPLVSYNAPCFEGWFVGAEPPPWVATPTPPPVFCGVVYLAPVLTLGSHPPHVLSGGLPGPNHPPG